VGLKHVIQHGSQEEHEKQQRQGCALGLPDWRVFSWLSMTLPIIEVDSEPESIWLVK